MLGIKLSILIVYLFYRALVYWLWVKVSTALFEENLVQILDPVSVQAQTFY